MKLEAITSHWPLTYFSVLGDGAGVDLQDVQTSLFVGQFNIYDTVGDF